MATATFKFVPANPPFGPGDVDQHTVVYLGTITFSAAGDTYATGGLLPLAGFGLPNLGPYADRAPIVIYIESLAASGWWYLFNTATGKLKIISAAGTGTAAPTEVTNGTALNAATPNIFTDVVAFEARFQRV
jgi:hypothetical protein